MTDTKNLWGGRFTEAPDKTFAEFNNSFRFDRRLFAADGLASIAHANGLEKAGVLTKDEAADIRTALQTLLEKAESDGAFLEGDAEDVHSFIEAKLVEIIGESGKKLHTGRSRNDQVATAFRIWLREQVDSIAQTVIAPIKRLSDSVNPITRGLAAVQRVLDLIDGAQAESSGTHAAARRLRSSSAPGFQPSGNAVSMKRVVALPSAKSG